MMLSVREVADLLGCGKTLVNRLIKDGAIKSYKIGGVRRIPPDGLRQYLASVAEGMDTESRS